MYFDAINGRLTVTANGVGDAVVNLCDGDVRLRAAVIVLASACVVVAGDVVVLVGQGNGALALGSVSTPARPVANRNIRE